MSATPATKASAVLLHSAASLYSAGCGRMRETAPIVAEICERSGLSRKQVLKGGRHLATKGIVRQTKKDGDTAYEKIEILYRVLVDVSKRSQNTTLFGQSLATPILIAPTAFHRLAHPEGELATAKGAARAGTIMILSSLSNTRVEEVAAAGAPIWFQLYVYKDRKATEGLVRRAEDWRWGSLARFAGRVPGDDPPALAPWPLPRSRGWVARVNAPLTAAEEEAVGRSIARGQPFGSADWQAATAARLGLTSTLRPRGRPRKAPERGS